MPRRPAGMPSYRGRFRFRRRGGRFRPNPRQSREALPGPSGGPPGGDGAPRQVPRPDRDGPGRRCGAGLPRPHQVGAPPPLHPPPTIPEALGAPRRSPRATRRPGAPPCRHSRARPSGSPTVCAVLEAPPCSSRPGAGHASASSRPEVSTEWARMSRDWGCRWVEARLASLQVGPAAAQRPRQGEGCASAAQPSPKRPGLHLNE